MNTILVKAVGYRDGNAEVKIIRPGFDREIMSPFRGKRLDRIELTVSADTLADMATLGDVLSPENVDKFSHHVRDCLTKDNSVGQVRTRNFEYSGIDEVATKPRALFDTRRIPMEVFKTEKPQFSELELEVIRMALSELAFHNKGFLTPIKPFDGHRGPVPAAVAMIQAVIGELQNKLGKGCAAPKEYEPAPSPVNPADLYRGDESMTE
ncbi:hypothetical protein [Spirosoma fluviale]|uniref:Uncharacterized protein n=1 Tax=Spirosoma fluviale TaxID=1597977 RepID=A0A286FCG9_9BACT|nr:hypothetical protein [Spirosoma fluviale]SOD80902.1 hypothetical protein SAMN06269250_1605 [Spirosoma fluviale]